jgi:hypothetical protein
VAVGGTVQLRYHRRPGLHSVMLFQAWCLHPWCNAHRPIQEPPTTQAAHAARSSAGRAASRTVLRAAAGRPGGPTAELPVAQSGGGRSLRALLYLRSLSLAVIFLALSACACTVGTAFCFTKDCLETPCKATSALDALTHIHNSRNDELHKKHGPAGTTGNPKGVMYTHRSNLLHAMVAALPDALALGSASTMLMVVPQFHVSCHPAAGEERGRRPIEGRGNQVRSLAFGACRPLTPPPPPSQPPRPAGRPTAGVSLSRRQWWARGWCCRGPTWTGRAFTT